jgi:hypothetical protein
MSKRFDMDPEAQAARKRQRLAMRVNRVPGIFHALFSICIYPDIDAKDGVDPNFRFIAPNN